MAQQTTPTAAYTEALHGTSGFLGWSHYRQTDLGLHVDADDEAVEVWSADGGLDTRIEIDGSCNTFLDDLDAAMDEAA